MKTAVQLDQLPLKALKWLTRKTGSTIEEWWSLSGGLEVKPARLPGLVAGSPLTPADAASTVLKGITRFSLINDNALSVARERFPEAMTLLLGDADRLCRNQFRILGEEIDFSAGIRWHLDPRNNHQFDPGRFFSRIPHSHPEGGYDIKYPWELSRLQHFPRLALAYRLTGDDKYKKTLIDQAGDWIRQNPVGFGPNWACTMDVSIRAANLAYSFSLLDDVRLDADFSVTLVGSLIAHGRFIANHLEWSDELTSNHYLADIAGLAVLACLLSTSVPETSAWLDFARDELATEIDKQVLSDGWDFEASTAYHRLALEFFLIPAIFMERAGMRTQQSYQAALRSMAQFVRDITLSDGSFPLIGDNDSGLFVSLQPRDSSKLDYLLALSAAYLQDQSLKTPDLKACPEILWLLGAGSFNWFENMPATRRPQVAEYPDGGLWALRSDDERDLLTFRLGPVGQKGNGGHAHNDQLSVTIWFDGRPVIVDPGTALYTSDPAIRNLYRSTSSHSTISIGEVEQNPFVNRNLFTLPQYAEPHLVGIDSTWESAAVEGALKGYGHWGSDDVGMRRRVRHLRDQRRFEIEDNVKLSEGFQEEIVWNFALAPGLDAKVRGEGHLQILDETGEPVADILFYPGWHVELTQTTFSPEYGVEIPNITLRFKPPEDTLQAKFIIRPAQTNPGPSLTQ